MGEVDEVGEGEMGEEEGGGEGEASRGLHEDRSRF